MTSLTFERPVGRTGPRFPARIGMRIWRPFSSVKLLIARRDPDALSRWGAFVAWLLGLAIAFHLPRRRVCARLRADGRLDLVARADRRVDFDREFGALLESLVAERGAAPGAAAR